MNTIMLIANYFKALAEQNLNIAHTPEAPRLGWLNAINEKPPGSHLRLDLGPCIILDYPVATHTDDFTETGISIYGLRVMVYQHFDLDDNELIIMNNCLNTTEQLFARLRYDVEREQSPFLGLRLNSARRSRVVTAYDNCIGYEFTLTFHMQHVIYEPNHWLPIPDNE